MKNMKELIVGRALGRSRLGLYKIVGSDPWEICASSVADPVERIVDELVGIHIHNKILDISLR